MRTTAVGIELDKHFESCSLTSYIVKYRDPKTGQWIFEDQATLGWGLAIPLSQHPKTITQAQADADLIHTIESREPLLEKLFGPTTMSVILPYQWDASMSLFYNTGYTHAFIVSHFVGLMRNGQFHLASEEFLKWDHGYKGIVLEGLLDRRKSEQFIFNGGSIEDLRAKHFFQK